MTDDNLLELLELYSAHIAEQDGLIIQLIENIKKLETDNLHYKNIMEHFDIPGIAEIPEE